MEEKNIIESKLKRIEALIYVIIIVLVVDTIVLFAQAQDKEVTETTTEETETEYDVSMFQSINADEFVDAYNGSELKVVYFGRSTCGYCIQFLPVLQQAQKDYDYKTLYVDITTINSDGVNKIGQLDTFFSENYGRTPMVVLVKDGNIIDKQLGYTDYSTFASLLEKNGFTK